MLIVDVDKSDYVRFLILNVFYHIFPWSVYFMETGLKPHENAVDD